MSTIVNKTDAEIKTDVLSELGYEPSVKATDIGVLVKDGTVTLNGYATNYGEKVGAVRTARRVAGVRAIADDIIVKLPGSLKRNDGDIAAAAANQIEWTPALKGLVQVTVREGWITLEGHVEWGYQKEYAEEIVHHQSGVKGVSNLILIKAKAAPTSVEMAIKAAFVRNALLDAKKIEVEACENKVILRGEVRNYTEREEAERVAWAAAGVGAVDNQLSVEWSSLGE
jgi:osmotically-inducible protein OsmY